MDWWVRAVLDRVTTVLPMFLDSSEFRRSVPDCQDPEAVTLLVGYLYHQVLKRVSSWEEIAWWTQDIITRCALEEGVEIFFNTLDAGRARDSGLPGASWRGSRIRGAWRGRWTIWLGS